jgi:hypothetical protein
MCLFLFLYFYELAIMQGLQKSGHKEIDFIGQKLGSKTHDETREAGILISAHD